MLDYQSNAKARNTFPLRNLFTASSSSTVVAQESHVTVSAHQFTSSFQSSEYATFAARSITQQANKHVAVENLSSLKKQQSCLRWYHLTYRSQLEYILQLARSREQIRLLSQDDLNLVIKCCDYQGVLIISDRRKLTRLAIEIFTYFADYKISLPIAAINALITELKKNDPRTFANVLYTLSLVVCNGQDLKIKEADLLNDAIRNFFRDSDKCLQFSVLVLGLLALTKQGVELKPEELEFLRKSLAHLGDDKFESVFPRPTVTAQYHPHDRHGSWYSFNILGSVKNLAKNKQLLSKKEITSVIRHWHTENVVAKKLKVIQILRNVILNGQNDFADPLAVEVILKEALESSVKKIRANAIAAAACLIKLYAGKSHNPYKQLVGKLNQVLDTQRLHVLQAINFFLCKLQNLSKLDSKWRTVLQELNQQPATTDAISIEVNKKSKYILSLVNGDLKNLEDLILDDAFCEEAVYLLTQKTEQGLSISLKTLENLGVLISDAKYSLKIKVNAAIVISNVAKSKQAIPINLLKVMVKYACDTKDVAFRNSTWLALGYCADRFYKEIVNTESLSALGASLCDGQASLNTTFAIKGIFEAVPAEYSSDNFLIIFKNIGLVLENKNNIYCADTIFNALLALLHAAKKSFSLPTALINQIGIFINSTSCIDDNKSIVLEIINYVIQSKINIEFDELFLIQIIDLLKSGHKVVRNNANCVLLAYLDKTCCGFSEKTQLILADLMIDDSLEYFVLEIFKKIISKNLRFSYPLLDQICKCLLSPDKESRISAAWIVKKSVANHDLSDTSLALLKQAIDDTSYDVKNHAVSALKKCFVRKKTIIFSSENCISLVSLIYQGCDNSKLQSNILDLLNLISSDKQRFCTYVIYMLGEILKSQDLDLNNAIIKIITHQFSLHADFRKEVFDSIIESLEALLFEGEVSANVVLALAEAKKSNYLLSQTALKNLAYFLLTSPDENLRKYAYEIIATVKSRNLARKIQRIKIIESDGITLMATQSETDSENQRYQAALRLRDSAKNKQLITVTVWSAFESVMVLSNDELRVLVTEAIYFAIRNGQQPSAKLIESLVAFIDYANASIDIDISYAVKALLLTAKDGRYLPDAAFLLCENLFTAEVRTELFLEYLQLIELGVKRNGNLKSNVLNQILFCMYHEETDAQYFAVRIIYALTKNKKCSVGIIDFILTRLINCEDQRLTKYLCKIVIRLFNQIDKKLVKVDLSILNNQLKNIEDNNLRAEIIALLKSCGQLSVSESPIPLALGAAHQDLTLLKPTYELIDNLCKNNSVSSSHSINFTLLFKDRIAKLIKSGWSTQKLYELLTQLKSNNQYNRNLENIFMLFDVAYCCGLSESKFYKHDFSNFSEDGFIKLNQSAIKKLFSDDEGEKDRNTLLEEIASNDGNRSAAFVKDWIHSGKALAMLEQQDLFFSTVQELPSLYKSYIPIKDWQATDIQAWAGHVWAIANKQENIWPEMFAVIRRAFYLQWKCEPRNSQLIAVLALLSGNRLAEISTGEGKTAIIAIWAVIKALYQIPVDVITSSSVLAKRDARLNKDFYQMFNLKVASNEDDKSRYGLKKCYAKDVAIVYGDLNNFQFDLLREEYSLLGTRGGRAFGVAIIDEVDSPLVDGSAKVAMLSSSMPGIRQLQPLMIVIWQGLQNLLEQMICVDNKTILKVCSDQQNVKPKFYELDNPQHYLFVKLYDRVNALIENNTDAILVPDHLKNFAKQQLPKWITNAIIAHFDYKQDHHYKIGLNQAGIETILPLDFANTGQTQKGTTWSDGLQQFLQIKHGLKFTPESLITNLMSNSAFVERYKGNICGLTGTLGSVQTRAFLAKNYAVDFINLPSHKTKRFAMLPNIAAHTQEAWQDEITVSACKEAKAGRVVIILCETIEKAKSILALAARLQKSGQIKSYIESDSDQSRFLDDTLQGNTIIVATNLAGRGTDPKISEDVIKKYGVHVIFTFLPINSRVHQQGLGRAGRAGKPGTGQIILNLQDLYTPAVIKSLKPEELTVEAIIQQRDRNEAAYLQQFEDEELPRIKIKDQLFHQFCELLKELKEIDQLDKNKPLDESYYHCKRQAVEERWGLWLKQHAIKPPFESVKDEFDKFKQQILIDYKNDTVIQNPFYYIRYANNLLIYADSFKSKIRNFLQIDSTIEIYKTAIDFYDKAIALDQTFTYLAYYYKAYALIRLGDATSRRIAKNCLITAKAIIEDHTLKQLLATESAISSVAKNGELSHQLSYEINALINLCANIEESLDAINRVNKKVDLGILEGNTIIPDLLVVQATQQINDSNVNRCSLSIYHFKTYVDVKRIYEAESAIEAMQDNATVNIVFSSRSLKKKHQQIWRELLPINQQPKEEDENAAHSNQQTQEQEKIGLYENVTAATNKVVSGVSGLLSKAKNGINNKIIKPLENWWKDYEQAKKIPVNICFKSLKVADIEAIFGQLKKLIQAPLNIDIKLFNKNKSFSNDLTSFDVENTFPQSKEDEYGDDEFTVAFSNVAQEVASKVLTVAPANTTLTFSTLTKQNAKRILRFTAEYHDQAVFEFNNISKEHALKLLKAVPAERPLESKLQSLESVLPHTSFATSELLEYQANGWFNLFSLGEQRPTPWRSIILLATTSLLQIATGFVLTALTAGLAANMGMALTIEGVCDAVRALNVVRSGQFDLNSYLLQKTLSLSWSLLTVGLSSALVASQTASASEQLSFTLTEVADEAAIQMIMNAQSVALKQTAQGLLSNTAKMMAQEGTGIVLDTGIYYTSSAIQKTVRDKVISEVERLVNEEIFQKTLQTIFAFDTCSDSETYQEILCHNIQNKLVEISNKYTLGLDKFQTIIDSYALPQVLSEFEVGFAELIRDVQLPLFSDLLRKQLRANFNDEQIEKICEILKNKKILVDDQSISLQPLCKQNNIVLTYTNFNKSKLDYERLNLAEFECYKSEIIDICTSFYMASIDRNYFKRNRFIQSVTDALTITIFKKTDSIASNIKGSITGVLGNLAGAATAKLFDELTTATPKLSEPAREQFSASTQQNQSKSFLNRKQRRKLRKAIFMSESSRRQQSASGSTLPSEKQRTVEVIQSNTPGRQPPTAKPDSLKNLVSLEDQIISRSKRSNSVAANPEPTNVPKKFGAENVSRQKIKSRKKNFVRAKQEPIRVVHINKQNNSSAQSRPRNNVFNPAVIFGCNSLDRYFLDISVSTIKSAVVVQYQKTLINEYNEKIKLFRKKLKEYGKKKSALDDKLIDEARKIIKLMLGLFIVEVKFSINSQQQNAKNNFNQEEIQNEIEELFKECIKNTHHEYEVLLNYLQRFKSDKTEIPRILSALKQSFLEFNQLIREANIMLDAAAGAVTKWSGDINMNDVVGKIMKSIDDRNYSQAGLLLREGKLGETGYLAGSMIEGLMKCKLASTQAHARMQVMLVALAEKTIQGEMEFRRKVLEIEDNRRSLVIKFNEALQQRMDRAMDFLNKAIDTGNDAYFKAAEKACDMVTASFPVMQEICKSNGMDPAFVTKCTEASTTVVSAMLQAVKEISKKEESELVAMFSAGKEIISKLIDVTYSKPQVGATNVVGQAQLLGQQGMFPAVANQPAQPVPQQPMAQVPVANAPGL